jgi:hypothetical protein
MKLSIKISDRKFNELLSYISTYEIPDNKRIQTQIRTFIATTLISEVLDGYDGFGRSEFFVWIDELVGKKFKLKKYND